MPIVYSVFRWVTISQYYCKHIHNVANTHIKYAVHRLAGKLTQFYKKHSNIIFLLMFMKLKQKCNYNVSILFYVQLFFIQEQGVDVQYCIVECGTTYFYLSWVVLIAIIKIISHVVAVTLAFRIRKIEVDAINDYKYTSAIVYISTVLILVLVIDIFVLNSYVNTFVMCTTLLIFSEGIVFLSLSFIPKVRTYCKQFSVLMYTLHYDTL